MFALTFQCTLIFDIKKPIRRLVLCSSIWLIWSKLCWARQKRLFSIFLTYRRKRWVWSHNTVHRCCIFDSSLFAAASFSCKLLGWAVSVRDGEDAWVWPDVAYDEPRPNHITTPITNTLSTKAISPKRFIVLPYGLYWNWPITGKWSDKSQVINTGSAVERRMRTSLRACIGWRWLLDDTT